MASTKENFGNSDIIAAVERLIAQKSVNSFSLKDVAKEAGISQGTLYYHYKTKDDLVLDLMKKHMGELKNDYDSWLKRHQDGSIDEKRFLSVIFYKGVKLFNKAKIHIYLINECLADYPSLKKAYLGLWNEWKDTLEEGIRTYFPKIEKPKSLAYLLMLIIDGLTVQEALEASDKPENDLISLVSKTMKEN